MRARDYVIPFSIAGVRYDDIVLHSISLCHYAGFADGHDQLNVQTQADSICKIMSLTLLLKDSANGPFHSAPRRLFHETARPHKNKLAWQPPVG